MTVYRRPDPIPLRRAVPATVPDRLAPVRSEPEALHHLVARRIFSAIVSGRYPAGSILPTENDLALELGVSRTALREAIKGLASKGLIESRRRRGTMVRDRRDWTMLDADLIAWSRTGPADRVSEELWNTLAAILPGLAADAAANHGTNLRAGGTEPRDFILGLAGAADNRFLLSIVAASLANLVADDPDFLARRLSQAAPLFATARAAINNGNAEAARLALQRAMASTTNAGASVTA